MAFHRSKSTKRRRFFEELKMLDYIRPVFMGGPGWAIAPPGKILGAVNCT